MLSASSKKGGNAGGGGSDDKGDTGDTGDKGRGDKIKQIGHVQREHRLTINCELSKKQRGSAQDAGQARQEAERREVEERSGGAAAGEYEKCRAKSGRV